MQRKIKFRAWDKEGKRMSKPFGLCEIYCPHGETVRAGGLSFSRESDFITMQYTGHQDKNGKEIYVGDIIRYKLDVWEIKFMYGAFGIYKYFTRKGFAHDKWDFMGLAFLDFDVEVIGNVYEDPDLLKGA